MTKKIKSMEIKSLHNHICKCCDTLQMILDIAYKQRMAHNKLNINLKRIE